MVLGRFCLGRRGRGEILLLFVLLLQVFHRVVVRQPDHAGPRVASFPNSYVTGNRQTSAEPDSEYDFEAL